MMNPESLLIGAAKKLVDRDFDGAEQDYRTVIAFVEGELKKPQTEAAKQELIGQQNRAIGGIQRTQIANRQRSAAAPPPPVSTPMPLADPAIPPVASITDASARRAEELVAEAEAYLRRPTANNYKEAFARLDQALQQSGLSPARRGEIQTRLATVGRDYADFRERFGQLTTARQLTNIESELIVARVLQNKNIEIGPDGEDLTDLISTKFQQLRERLVRVAGEQAVTADHLVEDGLNYLDAGALKEAVARYERAIRLLQGQEIKVSESSPTAEQTTAIAGIQSRLLEYPEITNAIKTYEARREAIRRLPELLERALPIHKQAEQLYNEGHYSEALRQIERMRGYRFQSSQFDEFEGCVRKALDAQARIAVKVQYYLDSARIALSNDDVVGVTTAIEAARAVEPQFTSKLLATLRAQANELINQVRQREEAITAELAAAQATLAEGKFDAAIQKVRALLIRRPNHAQAHKLLDEAIYQQVSNVINEADQLTDRNPLDVLNEVHLRLVRLPDKAREHSDTAMRVALDERIKATVTRLEQRIEQQQKATIREVNALISETDRYLEHGPLDLLNDIRDLLRGHLARVNALSDSEVRLALNEQVRERLARLGQRIKEEREATDQAKQREAALNDFEKLLAKDDFLQARELFKQAYQATNQLDPRPRRGIWLTQLASANPELYSEARIDLELAVTYLNQERYNLAVARINLWHQELAEIPPYRWLALETTVRAAETADQLAEAVAQCKTDMMQALVKTWPDLNVYVEDLTRRYNLMGTARRQAQEQDRAFRETAEHAIKEGQRAEVAQSLPLALDYYQKAHAALRRLSQPDKAYLHWLNVHCEQLSRQMALQDLANFARELRPERQDQAELLAHRAATALPDLAPIFALLVQQGEPQPDVAQQANKAGQQAMMSLEQALRSQSNEATQRLQSKIDQTTKLLEEKLATATARLEQKLGEKRADPLAAPHLPQGRTTFPWWVLAILGANLILTLFFGIGLGLAQTRPAPVSTSADPMIAAPTITATKTPRPSMTLVTPTAAAVVAMATPTPTATLTVEQRIAKGLPKVTAEGNFPPEYAEIPAYLLRNRANQVYTDTQGYGLAPLFTAQDLKTVAPRTNGSGVFPYQYPLVGNGDTVALLDEAVTGTTKVYLVRIVKMTDPARAYGAGQTGWLPAVFIDGL